MNRSRQRTLAVVPARGGSKGLPRKNILQLGGKPLISWTISSALDAECVDTVIVSTDDEEIADIARGAGAEVPFMRPVELASDTATSVDVMAHALTEMQGYEAAVLLQPTSPFCTSTDLDAGYALWKTSGAPNCVSVRIATESPWLMYSRSETGKLSALQHPRTTGQRRQDLPFVYMLNGAFYFVQTKRFLRDLIFVQQETVGYEMPLSRSLDIDTAADLEAARMTLAAWGGKVSKE
jgi:CMP-N,N'-diacetyllegionaminic acid synthase